MNSIITCYTKYLLSVTTLTAHCLLAALLNGAKPAPETVFFNMPGNLLPMAIPAPTAQLLAVPGYPNNPADLTLIAEVHLPDSAIHGPGPYPTVILLHGSGGLWSNDFIVNGLASAFDDWAEVLTDEGYILVLPDSFNPRGIPEHFRGRRPHNDPASDDALCSPNYERPKDVVATLTYLATRLDVDLDNIGLLGFSHGSQTGLNAIMDPSISKSPYTVNYINAMAQTVQQQVEDPVQIPNNLPFPKICAFYYPGCGHFGYHGQASTIAANRYMPDQRTHVLMFHGTNDSLLGVDDPNVTPMTGNLFPINFVLSSQAQADNLAVSNPFQHHLIFEMAEHSFDEADIEPEMNWNTMQEDADEKAKRLARDEVLKWFTFHFKSPEFTITNNENLALSSKVTWQSYTGIDYQPQRNDDLGTWIDYGSMESGNDAVIERVIDLLPSDKAFIRLNYSPQAPPTAAPENTGFFRPYSDFQY